WSGFGAIWKREGGFEEHPEPQQSLEQSTGKFERVGEELEDTQIPRIGWSKKGVRSCKRSLQSVT
ncbi:unnamed protein product, partial [Linum tenue]